MIRVDLNTMPRPQLFLLTALAMLAFAGNSLLCRAALLHTGMDAASFTTARLVSASLMLSVLCWLSGYRSGVANDPGKGRANDTSGGNWVSAVALFGYAIGFSVAYIHLPAGTGALLLFGAVQATMIGWGIYQGERLAGIRLAGFALAMLGLVVLLLPGLAAPPFLSAVSMLGAGIAWGIYSLRGKRVASPIAATAGNFLRTVPMTLAFSLVSINALSLSRAGLLYAVVSGALTSGVGYAVWYKVLPNLPTSNAATVQLSVPVIAALGGVVLIGEPLSWRLVGAAIAILMGIALVILNAKPSVALRQ